MQSIPILLLLVQLLFIPAQSTSEVIVEPQPIILREEVPMLMYHEIDTPSGPWKELYVEPEVLAQQLDWLVGNGYSTVSLADVYDHWYHDKPLPAKPIVLTFDDGYRSMSEVVLPLFLERNMQATFFLYPSKFGTANGLTTEMVHDLAQKGMEIGSHTSTHNDLTKINPNQFEKELLDSKRLLEEITGKPVNFLCYPAGQFNKQVIAETKKFGYLAAVTTQMGTATPKQDPYQWKRVRINYSDGLTGFIKKISK